MAFNAHGLWVGGLIGVCLSGCGKPHPVVKTAVPSAAVEQTAVPSAATTVPVEPRARPPVASKPAEAQPVATEPGIPFAEWIKSMAPRTRTAAPIAPLAVPAPRSSMMAEYWRQALADVVASRASVGPREATTIVPLSEPGIPATQATAAPEASSKPPAAQAEKAPPAPDNDKAKASRRVSEQAARKVYERAASLYGAGAGYTGEGAGVGYTGPGAGVGYTGAGAGDGYTGAGAGDGYTGAGAGDGYTGVTAGAAPQEPPSPPLGLIWSPYGAVLVPVQPLY
jgi:hypothetical protein